MKLDLLYNNKLHKAGLKVAKLLQQNSFQAFWVGGVVRDILLKYKSDNIDIATDALPDEVEKILRKAKIRYGALGKHFGTIMAIVKKVPVEITTFRTEGRYSNKRHPDKIVFIKDFLQDAKRRDFTINALYFDPVTKEFFDPTNGIKDLGLKLIRFIGDPKKKIDEDALRMLRGVRLATQLNFKLEKNTFAAIKTRAKYIQGLSINQINKETEKISDENLLKQTGLMKFIK